MEYQEQETRLYSVGFMVELGYIKDFLMDFMEDNEEF